MSMKHFGVKLIESDSFDFNIDDDNKVIIFKGDLSSDSATVFRHLKNNSVFKNLDDASSNIALDAIVKFMFRSGEIGKKNEQMLNRLGYICDQEISWNEFIPIQQVQLDGDFHKVDKDALASAGYGIKRFSILNYECLTGTVKCLGKHPNVHDGILCGSTLPKGKPVSIQTLDMIKVLLSVANLDHCYRRSDIDKIKEYIV